jgi:methionyl-tRNA formyltransferase
VFFGTPRWAVPSLEALLRTHHEIAAVVSNPDRPAGRGMEPQPPDVKVAAASAGVPVLQPEKARDEGFHDSLRALAPDCCVVVAYGRILPASLLAIPPLGFVNVHFSLLPAYRGAAPVQRAIMDGVKETGVSIMVLSEGMDEGPVLATASVPVGENDTSGSVGDRLAEVGADLLVDRLDAYAAGSIRPTEQVHDSATYAPKIATEEARIDWSQPATSIRNLVRALDPAPGAWTMLGDKRLKVFAVAPSDETDLNPGELRARDGLVAGTGEGAVALVDVQPAGKRRMSGEEFVRGLRDISGMHLS